MDNYLKEAKRFLKKHNAKMNIEFLKKDYYFNDDKEKRNIYRITLKRDNKKYTFKFGDSIHNTVKSIACNEYDILSCLQKYKIGSLKEFMRDYGYTYNNEKEYNQIEKIYKNVKKEYENVYNLFNDCMEELEEIQ